MQSFYSGSDVEANKATAPFAGGNPTWLHLVVSIHAISALSLCVFTVLGYVANTIAMELVVLFIFQTFMAILGLTAIEQNRQDYRSLYVAVNAVTAGSAIIWSTFLFINMKEHPIYVPVVLLIIAIFSLIATILLIFFADKRTPQILERVICLDLFPFVKLLRDTNRISKTANSKRYPLNLINEIQGSIKEMKSSCNTLLCISLIAFTSFFGREKSLDDTQLIERKEVNSAQLIRMKEVNSNESLNGSIKSVGSQEQQKDSSEIKTGASASATEKQQQQCVSEIKNDKCAFGGSRIAAGAEGNAMEATMEVVRLEETNNKTTNNAALSYEHYFTIGSNWREFYSVPTLNACNVALCSTGRTDRNRLRRRLLIKKCRNKRKIRKIIPKFSPLEKNIFEDCSQSNADQNLKKRKFVKKDS